MKSPISCRRLVVFAAAVLVCGTQRSPAAPPNDPELTLQQERQRQVQADADAVVRRLGTMLRVLDYYQIDKVGERRVIGEMKGILAGLSRNQMNEVIRRLEKAAQAPNPAKAAVDVNVAYDRHREILDALKALLARHDAVRDLDHAAELLDKLAKDQLELHLQTGQLIQDSADRANPRLPPSRRAVLERRLGLGLEPMRQADAQAEIHHDADRVIAQAYELRTSLPAEQKGRVERMRQLADKYRLVVILNDSAQGLKSSGSPAQHADVWKAINKVQMEAAGQLSELALALRAASDRLSALREARERIDQALAKQTEINAETKDIAKALEAAAASKDATAKALQDAQAAEKTQELGKEQARVEYETKDVSGLLKPHVADIAGQLEQARVAMHDSRQELTKSQPLQAIRAQEQATKNLQAARANLDKLLAAAEKKANDPLAALRQAAAKLDDLIKDQTATRAQTKETKDAARLPALAKSQKELAQRAKDLKDTPLPASDATKAHFRDAAKAMAQAAQALNKRQANSAVPKQTQALKAIQEARKEMSAKVAELAQRQADLAKLQESTDKLGQLAKSEKDVADKAAAMETKPSAADAKELAKTQDKLTPRAKDIAKNLASAAPDAAKDVGAATENMAAAKNELDRGRGAAAASQANQAARKLTSAQQRLAKALADLQAKNLADQAALQPNKVDPEAAAQLIAKALEQTQNAESHASESAELTAKGAKSAKAALDLAHLQASIAKQADQLNLPSAGKDASKAADSLRQGALEDAIDKQESTLAKLHDADHGPAPAPKTAEPTPAETKAMQGIAKNADAKDGTPPAAQAKSNPLEPGASKAEPKAGAAKAGQKKAGHVHGGQRPALAKINQTAAAESKVAQPKGVTVRPTKAGAANRSEPKSGEPQAAQAKKGNSGGPKVSAKAMPTNKPGKANAAQAKDGHAHVGAAKAGAPINGEAKMARAHPGASKAGQGTQTLAKAGARDDITGEPAEPEEAQAKADTESPLPQAKNAAELAQTQQHVMDATKALAQSHDATQAAMAALGQAQAQAPLGVQKQLAAAGRQLAKANQNLQQGRPSQAGTRQNMAAKDLAAALKAMNAALAAMNRPPAEPGQAATAQAKADELGEQGEETAAGEPMAQGKEGQGKKSGQAKSAKSGPSQEKNEATGAGRRTADGKLANAKARLTNAGGDGSFLHLPPRQRELIRQALSGRLPPEYAAMIEQYYMNIARGRAGTTVPPPIAPGNGEP